MGINKSVDPAKLLSDAIKKQQKVIENAKIVSEAIRQEAEIVTLTRKG